MSPELRFQPSANIAQLKESATIAVSTKAKALRAEGRQIIDLGAGEPDFDTPEFIRRAAQRAIDAGATRYTLTEGILPLREAIAAEANRHWTGADPVKAAEVVVSTGSKQSLFNACFSLFGPGDEVLVPVPSWTSYFEMVELARATVVPVLGDPARGFKVTAASLAQVATPRTRGLMLNSPVNPTGSVYDAAELRAILDLASQRGWWVLSDEIYQRIAYGGAPAPGALDVAASRHNLIVINGVAKAYAMTGWRIGWTISPAPVAKAMNALQSHTTSNAAAVSQHAALAALTQVAEADAAIAAMVAQFRARRDAALAILGEEPRLKVLAPDGAFYLYMRAPLGLAGGEAGTAFASYLLENHNVAAVPGSAFLTPDWIRTSYAAEQSQVEDAMRRIVAAFRELS
ncbi:MAG: pyridoxal phosphate-dependent aminotransferase [Gemmatimonadetes bacterium]|nr:pyridoxal phosphate-dependent aminotransferase [Gemmatimonadota bacterium]MBI3567867.1 pyridoxal phosphate-dependent aminotransferase [Gemmatimonadota bacterium]